ncbi:MAG: FAD:protein FMN transferase [Clostridia bacterium]|nr:FAD:protein FMN transferase [Clostridia bacterium]
MKTSARITAWLLSLLFVLTLLSGCAAKEDAEYRDFNYFSMDTYITLRLACTDKNGARLDDSVLASAADECASILADLDGTISAHDPSSAVYALNADINKMLSADATLLSLLATADKVHSLTGGAFDYTLGALTELWNVKGGGPVPSADDIKEALSHTGTGKFIVSGSLIEKRDPAAKLDFGGIGKGIAAQRLLEYLSTTEISHGLVSLGGNIGVFGEKPGYGDYKIGVRDPDDAGAVIGYLYLASGFVSVSGDYERYFEENGVRYHHILDPRTGYPADSGLRSVAVHTANGASADALSTALFILGAEKSMALYEEGTLDFEAVFVTDAGEILVTPGLTGDGLTGRFEKTNENYTMPGEESPEA